MGNCLDRAGSDEADEGGESSSRTRQSSTSSRTNSGSSSQRRHRSSNNNHYTRLNNPQGGNSSSSSSLISLNNASNQRIVSQNQDINHNYLHGTSVGSFQTTNGSSIFSPSSSIPESLQIVQASSLGLSSSLNNQGYSQNSMSQQVFYLNPSVQRTADQLTEEEQIKLLKRMTLIQQLPSGTYDENKKHKECVICMIDFEVKDRIKCLPCMHTFHQSCIDSWLVRSLICPSCMEPVDAGLLSAFENEQC